MARPFRFVALMSVSFSIALVTSCSSSSSPPSVSLAPGDHFFDSVATTTGSGAPSSFRLGIALYDPAYASKHPAGTPGSNASIKEAAGNLVLPTGQSVTVDGTWSTDGTVTLQGSGWSVQGKFGANVLTGSFQGSGGSGVLAGADITTGTATTYLGTQQGVGLDLVVLVPGAPKPAVIVADAGSDGGADAGPRRGGNFVDAGADAGATTGTTAAGSGIVTGVIGGASGGTITGTSSGGAITFTWQANGTSGSGSGTASAGSAGGSTIPQGCTTPPAQWACGVSSVPAINGEECGCVPSSLAPASAATTTSCPGTWDCCIAYNATNPGGPWCQCQRGTNVTCDPSSPANGETGTLVASCPSGPAPSTPGATSSCAQSWQAAPAPCPKSVGGACLTYDFAQDPDSAQGDNGCPPSGGCTSYGAYSACCIE